MPAWAARVGAHVDDAPAAARQQVRQRGLRREQCGAHVERIQAVPGFDAAGLDGLVFEPAGDVGQAVECAEARDDLVHRAARGIRLAEVDVGQRQHAGAQAGRRTRLVDQRHLGAGGLECITQARPSAPKPPVTAMVFPASDNVTT